MSMSVSYQLSDDFDELSIWKKFQLKISSWYLFRKKSRRYLASPASQLLDSRLDQLFSTQIIVFKEAQDKIDALYEVLLEIDQQPISEHKSKLIRARKILTLIPTQHLEEMEDSETRWPSGKAYLSQIEATLSSLDRTIERLTLFDHLSQNAVFLLALPDDERYAVMNLGMARVHKAMDKDPEGKAEYESEIKSWMDFPFDPIIEYQD
jgi:hypothetical protein